MIDWTGAVEAGRAGDAVRDDAHRPARGGQRRVRRAEQRHDGGAQGGGEMADARVTAHERVQLGEDRGEQLGRVPPDDARLNPYGGAIACGHPLAATGVRLIAQLARGFRDRPGSRYGLTALCIGLGMGAAILWENLQGG